MTDDYNLCLHDTGSTLLSPQSIHTNILLHQRSTFQQACFTWNLSFFFLCQSTFFLADRKISVINLCSLLLRRECCSFSNGEYVKAGLAELEQWCIEATDEVSRDFVTLCLSVA